MAARPKIPFDPLPNTTHHNIKRRLRRLAEAGKRLGRPVKQLPLYRMKPEPPEMIA